MPDHRRANVVLWPRANKHNREFRVLPRYRPMEPVDVLRLIAAYRFILPKADIGVFGGRERALRELQPLMFIAGANATLIGDYLTTKGQSPNKDLQMIKDLGLEIERGHA